jgi:hypothetical protein
MTEAETTCPVCGERLAIKGLSFFMINVVVDKHCKASPACNLRVELTPKTSAWRSGKFPMARKPEGPALAQVSSAGFGPS